MVSTDDETRRLALQTLSQLPNLDARNELRRLEQDSKLESVWRELCTQYLIAAWRPETTSASVSTETPATIDKYVPR